MSLRCSQENRQRRNRGVGNARGRGAREAELHGAISQGRAAQGEEGSGGVSDVGEVILRKIRESDWQVTSNARGRMAENAYPSPAFWRRLPAVR